MSAPHAMEPMDLEPRQIADLLFESKQFDLARVTYEQLVEQGETDTSLFRRLVKTYKALDRLDEGEAFFTNHLSKHANSSSAMYALGYVDYLQEDLDGSETWLNKAVEADSKNALAWNHLGVISADKEEVDPAIEKIKKAIALSPKELLFYRNLKRIYLKHSLSDRFEKEYRESLGKESDRAWGYGMVLARGLRQQGFQDYSEDDLAGTIEKFEKMLEIYKQIDHPSGIVSGYFSLGLLYEETGNAEKSQEYFREVLKINPDHIQARDKVKSGKN